MKGFTLIELLIVLVILAVLGVLANINFRTLSEDQVLKKAVGDIQSFLRLAQSNSTAGVKCPSSPSGSTAGSWSVEFNSDKKTLYSYCGYTDSAGNPVTPAKVKTLLLDDQVVEVNAISGTGTGCSLTFPTSSFTVYYSSLIGDITFSDNDCSDVTITLKNKKTTATKNLILNKGGSIDVQ